MCCVIEGLYDDPLIVFALVAGKATVAPTGHKVSSEQSFNRQTHELLTTTLTLLIEIRSLFRNNTYL